MKEMILESHTGNFICGVVEGFYGRPWTTNQRKVLFKRMDKFGLNMYLYAPKDDAKHRVFWRELYSVEEAEHLTSLIESSKQSGVTFVYALSPGIDITYSSSKDVLCLKRKLEQVATFGCNAFALLFDDIEPEMNIADKEVFQSFGHAQVSVTNETFQHLNAPSFLFCPTEYCASRAVPSVKESEYLNTIGSKLLPTIHILWTGSKVITKKICIQSIQEISKVLNRKPVIWDNFHANDYDIGRIFLGPYDGRSPDLIPHIAGVLSNPNCEYEANFIALHTLGQWSRSNHESQRNDLESNSSDQVSSDIKLETENDEGETDQEMLPPGTYQPKVALKLAMQEWMDVFYLTVSAEGRHITKAMMPINPSVLSTSQISTCISVTPTTSSNVVSGKPVSAITNLNQMTSELPPLFDSYIQPLMSAQPVNSLIEATEGNNSEIVDSKTADVINNSEAIVEPMECVPETEKEDNEKMQTDADDAINKSDENVKSSIKDEDKLSYEDLALLVDLFYLPFEHGSQGVHFLQEFFWLKTNANLITENKRKKNSPQVEEWHERAGKFDKMVKDVGRMSDRLYKIPNRSLLHDLNPYVWDMRGVLALLNSFVKWLGCTQGHKDAFMSGEQEPWVFRGGLTGEFQRMLPIDGAHDLFNAIPPEKLSSKVFSIRPYLASDETAVYDVCRQTCDDGLDGSDIFPDHPELIGDLRIGGLVTTSPEYGFVVEDDVGICAYAVAAIDSRITNKQIKMAWIPAMCEKYPKPEETVGLSPAEEIIVQFHKYNGILPDALYKVHPSVLKMDILPQRVEDPSVAKRLLACVLAALKSNGSRGVYCEIDMGDQHMVEFFSKLGFFVLPSESQISEETITLGRVI